MFDCHCLQPWWFFGGEMSFNSLQDKSDLCLTIPGPVEAVLDKCLAEFDVLRVSASGENRLHSGKYAGVRLPLDLVIESGKDLVELIRRHAAYESTDHVILNHA